MFHQKKGDFGASLPFFSQLNVESDGADCRVCYAGVYAAEYGCLLDEVGAYVLSALVTAESDVQRGFWRSIIYCRVD